MKCRSHSRQKLPLHEFANKVIFYANYSFFVQSPKGTVIGKNVAEKTPAEAAKEIQDLLAQLQTNYPTTTEYEKQVFVNKFNDEVKTNFRVRDVILAGGIELIKILCPPLGIPIEMGKRWLETAQKQK